MISSKIVKALFLVIITTPLFLSCTGELEEKIVQLEKEKVEADSSIADREAMITGFIQSMNEIEDNLSQIKERENVVTIRFDDGNIELDKSMNQQILDDVSLIDNLLIENKEKLSALSGKLKNSNLKIAELEKMLKSLAKRLEQKDVEIVKLHEDLTQANEQLKVLFDEYNDRLEEIGEQEDKLNTAYYCYGSSKELAEQGVISKKGGFIGIGKTATLSNDFNKEYFTKIDISLTHEIDLRSKKVEILTNHPSESYQIVGEEGAIEKILIKDVKQFWSASKYLVIIVE